MHDDNNAQSIYTDMKQEYKREHSVTRTTQVEAKEEQKLHFLGVITINKVFSKDKSIAHGKRALVAMWAGSALTYQEKNKS